MARQRAGLLQSLPTPSRFWHGVSINLITHSPLNARGNRAIINAARAPSMINNGHTLTSALRLRFDVDTMRCDIQTVCCSPDA